MCGLNVIFGSNNEEFQIRAMNDAIAHRGETSKYEISKYFTLGHVRLRIQGLSEKYDQPYHAYGWTFLYVGEIVNWRQHELFTEDMRSDIELLAKAWSRYGPQCVRAFDGFWAIAAVPDIAPWEIHVVTDFLCKKPLYLYSHRGRLIISSEIKAIGAVIPLDPDPVYFSSVQKFGYCMTNRTWAKYVSKFSHGAHVVLDKSRRNGYVSHMRIDPVEPVKMSSGQLKDAIVRSIEQRVLTSDVPIAMLVSGGLDSAILYQTARHLRNDITIYHVENDEDEYLEALQPENPVKKITYGTYDLDDILWMNEGPVDLGSMIPQYLMADQIVEDVCLSGDGADELFGGYRRALEYDSQGSDIWDELVHYHLPRLDKLMMMNTVELRCPFLGREVLAGALALPYEVRQNKAWLRRMFEDDLPEKIVKAEKRPLKSNHVREDPIGWRRRLCARFLEILEERKS